MGMRNTAQLHRVPHEPVADGPGIARHGAPQRHQVEGGPEETQAGRVGEFLPVALLVIGGEQAAVETVDGAPAGAQGNPGPKVKRHHAGQVIGTVPVIGVKKRDGIEALGDRRERADAARQIAIVAMGLWQADVGDGEFVDQRIGMAIGNEEMPAGAMGLGADTSQASPENGVGLAVVGRDDGDARRPRRCRFRRLPRGGAGHGCGARLTILMHGLQYLTSAMTLQ